MEDLISLADTMQQASAYVGGGNNSEDSPSTYLQVVVVGTLPTAEGGATRFPVIVDLKQDQHVSDGEVRGKLGAKTNMQSSGEIRQAVQAEMKRWLPTSSKSQEETHLSIRSVSAPPLRVIDLPGLESRASDHDNMLMDHAANNDAFLLVVVPASQATDLNGARVLRIAQDLDREGTRTVGVITKLDEVSGDKDAVTAVVQLLTGLGPTQAQDFPWVVAIGQPTTAESAVGISESLEAAWKAEIDTLSSILRANGGRGLEPSIGRNGLMKVLARQMRQRMKERIPKLMSRGFDTKFLDNIEGGEGGGAKMVEKFVGALPGRFRGLPLDKLFAIENVKRVCTEADGYQPYLISPEKGLRLLVKKTLDLAKQPGLQCVDELVAVASGILDEYRSEARKMVNALVDMERVFIPPAHFIDAANRRAERMRKDEELQRKRDIDQRRTTTSSSSSDLSKAVSVVKQLLCDVQSGAAGEEPNKQGRMAAAMSSLRGKKDPPPPPPEPAKELAGFLWKVSSKNGWSKRWFALSDKTARLYYVKKPDEKAPRGVIPLEDCVVEDVVAPDDYPTIPASSDPLRGAQPQNAQTMQSLVFKLSNKVPYKTVVKVHHNLILRAENMQDKAQWVQRIRLLTKAGATQEAPPPEAAEKEAAPAAAAPVALKREEASQATVPMKRAPTDPEEDLKLMSQEVRQYVEVVLTNLSQNIPKAVVLSQVERAKEQMLTKLYTAVSTLPNHAVEELMTEDPESKAKREKANVQQEKLMQLRRALSLHEARASAEEANAATVTAAKENPLKEDWRVAFQTAGPRVSEPDAELTPAVPPPIPRKPRKSAPAPPADGPSENGGLPASGSSEKAEKTEKSKRSFFGLGSRGSKDKEEASAPPPAAPTSEAAAVNGTKSPLRSASPVRAAGNGSAGPEQAGGGPPMGPPMGRKPNRLPPPPPPGGAPVYRY
eukprot:jgi/Mesen1/7553/ME000392S06821